MTKRATYPLRPTVFTFVVNAWEVEEGDCTATDSRCTNENPEIDLQLIATMGRSGEFDMRTILTYLTIAALLLCPYNCAVGRDAQTFKDDGHSACCEQCRARETPEPVTPVNNESPKQPGPAEDGRFCLCEGAVFDAAARGPSVDSLHASLWTWGGDPAALLGSFLPVVSNDCTGAPSAYNGGLRARIVICSLIL